MSEATHDEEHRALQPDLFETPCGFLPTVHEQNVALTTTMATNLIPYISVDQPKNHEGEEIGSVTHTLALTSASYDPVSILHLTTPVEHGSHNLVEGAIDPSSIVVPPLTLFRCA